MKGQAWEVGVFMFKGLNIGRRVLDLFWVNASGEDDTRVENDYERKAGAGRLDASQIFGREEE